VGATVEREKGRRVPALPVVLGVFALFILSVVWGISESPDQVPGTIEYRSVVTTQGLAEGDEGTVRRQVAGGQVSVEELQQLWQEAEASYGEHLRTGRPFRSDRDDTTVWVIVPVEFDRAGVGLQFAYEEGLTVDDRLTLTDVRLTEVTEVSQGATQTVIVVVLVAGALGLTAFLWHRRNRA
jgi:hypothetical protein